jgi:hypothetical protein
LVLIHATDGGKRCLKGCGKPYLSVKIMDDR